MPAGEFAFRLDPSRHGNDHEDGEPGRRVDQQLRLERHQLGAAGVSERGCPVTGACVEKKDDGHADREGQLDNYPVIAEQTPPCPDRLQHSGEKRYQCERHNDGCGHEIKRPVHRASPAIAVGTAGLAHRPGVAGLTMSAIAREAGISRATLYRYASDTAEAVDLWRAHEIDQHLQKLQSVASQTTPERRLSDILDRDAVNLQHGHSDAGAVIPHHGSGITAAKNTVATLLQELILAGTVRGDVRTDLPVDELLVYTMTSLEAAAQLPSRQAAMRLANLVAQSLRPPYEHHPQAGRDAADRTVRPS